MLTILSLTFSLFLAQPKIIEMEDKLARDLGEKVNVTCKATGNPAPSVKWVTKSADGRHEPVTHVGENNHSLQIDSVQEEHYGDYVCFAENTFGNDTVVLALGKCWLWKILSACERLFVSCCCNTIPWQGHEFSEEFLNVQGNTWAFLEYLCGQQKVLDHVVFEAPNLSWCYVL